MTGPEPRPPTDEEFARAVRLLAEAEPIRQQLPGPIAFVLLSQLQLALRHPANRLQGRPDSAAAITRALAAQLQDALLKRCPELAPLLAMGWDPSYDVPIEPPPQERP